MDLDDSIPWEVEPMCDDQDENAPHGSNTDDEMDVDADDDDDS